MKIKIGLISAIIFSFGLFLSFNNVCYAISSSGLGIYPNQSEWNLKDISSKSWFVYNINPGETKTSKVDVRNESDKQVSLKIYPVDATTTKDGSFAPESEDSIKKDVGSWINMSVSEIFLNPKEVKTVDFTINPPLDANIGDHMGAIIIQNKDSLGEKNGTSMQVLNRIGARIYLTIPGEKIEKLEIGEFSNIVEKNKIIFQLTLINKGNTRIAPKGEIVIKDKLGNVVDQVQLTRREIFPKDTIVIPVNWGEILNGTFTALATIEYGNQKITKELSLINEKQILGVQHTNNFITIGLVAGVVLVFIFIMFFIRKCFY